MSVFDARPESKPLPPYLRVVEVYKPAAGAPEARTTEQDATLPTGVLSAPPEGFDGMWE